MSDALVRVEKLGKQFESAAGTIHVLRDLELRLEAGESVAVVGQSGVGKTTFLQILGTLDHPTTGSVFFRDEDVFAKTPDALARLRNAFLGFVFQFHNLLPEFDALENASMPARVQGMDRSEAEGRAERILRDVGLAARLRQPIGKLSGGERQRVAVARALVLDPPLVLADEPTGNLDPTIGEQISELVLELNRTRGTTLVVVTHNERLAARLGRTLVLEDGGLRPRA